MADPAPSQSYLSGTESEKDGDGTTITADATSLPEQQHVAFKAQDVQTADIKHLYLTFNTPVPTANTTNPSSGAATTAPTLPAAPNLSLFTNPTLWSQPRKRLVLVLCLMSSFLTAYTAGSYAPAEGLLLIQLGAPNTYSVTAGITMFTGGFGLAPMFLAPFSEINGRFPVFMTAGVMYVAFQAACGLVTNIEGMLFARFFTGVGGSVFSTMVGGVISDMYESKDRNTPMSLFSTFVLVGTGLGPLIASIMVQRLTYGEGDAAGWKWVFWHQVIMAGVLMIAFLFFFKESRGSVVLSRKAKALNKWYDELEQAGYHGVWTDQANKIRADGTQQTEPSDEEKRDFSTQDRELQRIRWRVKEDEERTSLLKMISTSVYRPFHLLLTEPVVFFFSLWVSFAWGVLYLTFASVPIVFEKVYNFDIEQAGYVFGAMSVGAVLGGLIGLLQERLLKIPQWAAAPVTGDSSDDSDGPRKPPPGAWAYIRRRFPASAPEARLYFTCFTSALLPVGLFIFGFTARTSIHWIAPTIGIAIATMGICSIYLAAFNYLADAYHKYASSALAAQSFCRNMMGGIFPLVTAPLFNNLGTANAAALLGSIAAALTVVPWVLVWFGSRIRARSPLAMVSPFNLC